MNNGGSVTYTVTPQSSYQLSTVTLRVDSQQVTAAADSKAIKISGKTYSMSLSDSGILKVTVSGIHDDVQLSVHAVWVGIGKLYLLSGITAPYFEGMGNNRFCPENTLTRAEAAVMLARLTNYSDLTVYLLQTGRNFYRSCRPDECDCGHWRQNERCTAEGRLGMGLAKAHLARMGHYQRHRRVYRLCPRAVRQPCNAGIKDTYNSR